MHSYSANITVLIHIVGFTVHLVYSVKVLVLNYTLNDVLVEL